MTKDKLVYLASLVRADIARREREIEARAKDVARARPGWQDDAMILARWREDLEWKRTVLRQLDAARNKLLQPST